MVAAIRELAVTAPSLFRLAATGTLALSFALAGCGRKGPLDPPPQAQVQPGDQVQQAPQGPTEDAYGNPIVPTGPKKKFFLDWLLN
jgi:predicted small lipoprotein YifL